LKVCNLSSKDALRGHTNQTMKRHKALLTLSVMALLGPLAHAQESKYALVNEHIKLSKSKEMIEATNQTYAEKLSGGNAALEKELKTHFESYMGWSVMEEALFNVVSETFTKEELKTINTMMKSPAGQLYATKSITMGVKLSERISEGLENAYKMRGVNDGATR